MIKQFLIAFLLIAGTVCSGKESTWCYNSNIYDEIYVSIKDDTIIFPVDFNYVLDGVPSDFDFELQIKGVINKKEKVIVCNNGISFSIYLYTDSLLTIEYGDQILNFVNIKCFVEKDKKIQYAKKTADQDIHSENVLKIKLEQDGKFLILEYINLSNDDIFVPEYYMCDDYCFGFSNEYLEIKDENDRKVKYIGIIGDFRIYELYVKIKKGSSIKVMVNLEEHYKMQKNLKYKVRYKFSGLKSDPIIFDYK